MTARHLSHTHWVEVRDGIVELRQAALGVPCLYCVRNKLPVRCYWLELLPIDLRSSVADSFAILNDLDLVLEKQLTHISVKSWLTFAPDIPSWSQSWLYDLILSDVMVEFCSRV